jgi:glycine dehydrogenase
VLAAGLKQLGVVIENASYFDTLTLNVGAKREALVAAAAAHKINFRLVDDARIGISLDETSTPALIETLFSIFGGAMKYRDVHAVSVLPEALTRSGACLTHSIFQTHHSETELLRYMRKLSDRDLALDRAMIPLGSCTMKLNATAEMMPVTWPEFGALHPFAPSAQTKGYSELFDELSQWLIDITGYEAISLQPNSGAQGEYAGLLAIRGYHLSRIAKFV